MPEKTEQAQYFLHVSVTENVESHMKIYYLLRNNKESGPFTLAELKEAPVFTTDLIWINGESTSWQEPGEIAELAGVAKDPVATAKSVRPNRAGAGETELSDLMDNKATFHPAPVNEQTELTSETIAEPSFNALKEKYAAKGRRKKVWKTQVSIGANLMGIAILLIGISGAAFMLKKAVDNIEPEPIAATAEAREIGETASYVSSSNQAAKALLPVVAKNEETGTGEPGTTTIAAKTDTETVEISGTESANDVNAPPPVKKERKNDLAEKETLAKATPEKDKGNPEKTPATENEGGNAVSPEKNNDVAMEDEKKKTAPKLELAVNEYKVGFLGGISNLELSVSNPSAEGISHAVVEVEYLKPNGKLVGTQQVEVSNLAPHATKKISVPDNGRGVTVRYRVVNTELK